MDSSKLLVCYKIHIFSQFWNSYTKASVGVTRVRDNEGNVSNESIYGVKKQGNEFCKTTGFQIVIYYDLEAIVIAKKSDTLSETIQKIESQMSGVLNSMQSISRSAKIFWVKGGQTPQWSLGQNVNWH